MEKDEISTKRTKELLHENMTTVKRNIKRIIVEKRMSQTDFAFFVKSSPQFVSYFLRRGGNATIEYIGRVADVLDTDVYNLLKK